MLLAAWCYTRNLSCIHWHKAELLKYMRALKWTFFLKCAWLVQVPSSSQNPVSFSVKAIGHIWGDTDHCLQSSTIVIKCNWQFWPLKIQLLMDFYYSLLRQNFSLYQNFLQAAQWQLFNHCNFITNKVKSRGSCQFKYIGTGLEESLLISLGFLQSFTNLTVSLQTL